MRMAQKKSSIEFTEPVKSILKTLTIRDSQKNVVSAGIVAFSKLTPDQRDKAIAEANGIDGQQLEFEKVPEPANALLELQKSAKTFKINIELHTGQKFNGTFSDLMLKASKIAKEKKEKESQPKPNTV